MAEQPEGAIPAGPSQARELEARGAVRDEFEAPVNGQNPQEGRENEEQSAARAREQVVEREQPAIPESKQPECQQNQEHIQRRGRGYGPIHNQQGRGNNQWGPYESGAPMNPGSQQLWGSGGMSLMSKVYSGKRDVMNTSTKHHF